MQRVIACWGRPATDPGHRQHEVRHADTGRCHGRWCVDACILGAQRPVWIAASTHEGEELAVLEAHRQVLQELPDALLLLAPRHPERFRLVEHVVRGRASAWRRAVSRMSPPPGMRFSSSMPWAS